VPSGRVHLQIEIGVLILLAAGFAPAALWGDPTFWKEAGGPALCFAGAYLFSALLLSPDMDLGRSHPQNRWGILRVLWRPYAGIFTHRGTSHNPLLGPLSRMLYLGAIIFAVWSGLHYGFSVEMVGLEDLVEWWKEGFSDVSLWAAVAGLILPNQIHILADRLLRN
jgi:uncharacterized metal-binding protein